METMEMKKTIKPLDKDLVAKEFGAFIREVRESRGWYQYEIAEALGMTRAYYTRIESGRDIYFSTALDICRVLNLDINEFMERLK